MKIAGIILHPTSDQLLDTFLAEPAHAVLLAGPIGIGKTLIATAAAKQLLNLTDAQGLENQAYFRSLEPVKGTISIESVRSLISFFRLTVPGNTKVKRVAVIADAEAMSREAQNALLKLLEEPPQGSVLLLTSSQPEQLLPTIRSRLQIIMLAAPEQEAIATHFIELGHEAAQVQRVLLRAGTNIATAAQLLTHAEGESDASLQLVKQVLVGSTYERMLLVDGLSKQKEQATAFVATLSATAAASLHSAASKNPANMPRWQAILEAADRASNALDRSGNTKLVLTELMLAL